MDTLKAIALDWDRKTIDDAEARRRADTLRKVVFHPDETVIGDGGWYEGDPDNLMTAVRAAIGTTKANEFAGILHPDLESETMRALAEVRRDGPCPGLVAW